MKLPRNWAALRKGALRRAGGRSSRSGKAGRLEVHHRRGRAHNGAKDLEVLSRSEHIDLHLSELGWKRRAWGALLRELSQTEGSYDEGAGIRS